MTKPAPALRLVGRPLLSEARLVAAAHAPADVDLEIVIPAFNEEHRLVRTVAALAAELATLGELRCRVTVVDNGSSDRTADLIDRLDTGPVETVVIGCARGGKGAAVRRGIFAARADVVGFMDADSSAPASAVPLALAALAAGADVVVGSRRVPGAAYVVRQKASRRVGSWAFRASIRSIGLDLADTQCGFKFFTRDAAAAIFSESTLHGFSFDVEALLTARRLGLTVAEVPIRWSDEAGSTLRPVAEARSLAREIRVIHRLAASHRSSAPGRSRAVDLPPAVGRLS